MPVLHPDTDVMVKWERTGDLNIVKAGDLICPNEGGLFRKGDQVVMPWGKEKWEAVVVDIGAESDDSSENSEDDIPLARLCGIQACATALNLTELEQIPLTDLVEPNQLDLTGNS